MSKRRLSQRQQARISNRQESYSDDIDVSNSKHGWVICSYGKSADVECTDTHAIIRCFIRPTVGQIVTGDEVTWIENEATEEVSGVIVHVQPRQTTLQRPDSYGKLKLVAANVDRLVITIAPEPMAHGNLIDRYLVVARQHGLDTLIVLNKADLLQTDDPVLALAESYRALGYPVLSVSAKQGIYLTDLANTLSEGVCVFTGQSGVGKSSLIQALLPDEAIKNTIKIGALSETIQKGKHTTTHATLYHFPKGGHCIDSPGIREFGLWHLTQEDVIAGFKEFDSVVGQCKFRDCKHASEPGCAIQSALQNGFLSPERSASYHQILSSLDDVSMR